MKHSLHILYKSALVIILSIMSIEKMDAQMIAVRNNVVYDATMSPNIGFELVVGERKTISIDFMGNYKPLGKDMKMMFLQPEFRYYFSGRPMFKHFVGLGLIGGGYDITWKGKVYDGMAFGMGMTFGYVKKITSRFNIDFHAGFGVIGYKQKEYYEGDHFDQDYMEGNERTNASGYTLLPTNIGVSLHYIIK